MPCSSTATATALSALSAWVDGELPPQDWDEAWQAACEGGDAEDDPLEAWHRYHLIGDVLRAPASAPVRVGPQCAQDSAALARQIMAQAKAQTPIQTQPQAQLLPPQLHPQAPAQARVATVATSQRDAANDGVFRWKLVSGLASVAAVVAVAWGVVAAPTAGNAPGPVLAQATAPLNPARASANPVQTVGWVDVPAAVLVSTPQGQVLRDPRLDALMLAHRQAGGASAWQVPAGFLRSATFDATQR